MKKFECYVCQTELTPVNQSEEHIVPNCIGGRVVSLNLLCKDCNSSLSDIDKEYAELFGVFMIRLGIKRQRGKPSPVKATDIITGEKVSIEWGGTSKLLEPIQRKIEGGIEIVASSKERLHQEIERQKRDNPKIDVEKMKSSATFKLVEIESQFHTSVDADVALLKRGLVKTAVNHFLANHGNVRLVSDAISYVCGRSTGDFASINEIGKEFELGHMVTLIGNRSEKRLAAEIRFLGFFRGSVALSNQFNGPDFRSSRFYPVKVEEN